MNHAATVKILWDAMTPAERKTVMERMYTTHRPLIGMALREAEERDGDAE